MSMRSRRHFLAFSLAAAVLSAAAGCPGQASFSCLTAQAAETETMSGRTSSPEEGTGQTETARSGSFSGATVDSTRHVLVLYSYTLAWDPERDVFEGMQDTAGSEVIMDYLFMDSKNLNQGTAEHTLSDRLDPLITKTRYDLIVAVDDNALSYVMKYRERKFSGIPIVFNNVNSLEQAEKAAEDPMVTGIAEGFFGKETIEIARKIQPEAARVIGIGDHSMSGQSAEANFESLRGEFPDLDFEFVDMMEQSRAGIEERFSSYDDRDILLFLNFTVDGDGNHYVMRDAASFLTSLTDNPIFKPDVDGVGTGLAGGCGGSYRQVGIDTAGIVARILSGTPAADIPVQQMEMQAVFDSDLLKRYGIRKSMLPSDTVFLNESPSFWQRYHTILIPLSLAIALLFVIIMFLLHDRSRMATLLRSREELSREEKLRRAAEARSVAATGFLSSVSHDLRTPLNGILGYTDLALEEKNPEKKQEYLIRLKEAGSLMLTIVNDTLDVSRAVAGKSTVRMSQVSVHELTDSIITSVRMQTEQKGIVFDTDIRDRDLMIETDRTKLQKIILNLLSNSVKYTSRGGNILLAVGSEPEQEDRIRLIIIVSDSGRGMSPEFQKIMFQPFEQENDGRDPSTHGTGLGLAIVRNNVDLLGGTVRCDSAPGEGTTFRVEIPARKTVIPSQKAEPETEKDRDDLSVLKEKHVLLCEDNRMNARIAQAILQKVGMHVDVAPEGLAAVEMFSRSVPGFYSAVLMDLRLPDIDGFTATRKIRALPRKDAATVPVIAMTADVYEGNEEKRKQAGMDAYLSKPVDRDRMLHLLAAWISGNGQPEA